jgi:hypothetical protein
MKRAVKLILLSGAAAFASVCYFEKGPAEAAVRVDLKHSALYLAPDTSCVFGFPDSAPHGLSVSLDSAEQTLTAEGRGLDPLRACAGPAAPISFTLNLTRCRGKADFSGMDVKQLGLSLKGGSFKCLAGKGAPPHSARSVRLNVKGARLWFERLGRKRERRENGPRFPGRNPGRVRARPRHGRQGGPGLSGKGQRDHHPRGPRPGVY